MTLKKVENKARIEELEELDKTKSGRPPKEDKEWNNHIKKKKKLNRLPPIFKSKKENTAINRYNKSLNDKRIPKKIKKFLERIKNILPNLINHIENDDIPSTNNKVEGFYKITLPGCKKELTEQ